MSELNQSLLYGLWRAQTAAQRAVERALEPFGLTVAQYGTLDSLAEGGPLSAAAVAKRHGVRPQSIAAAVRDLEQRRLVRRRPHPDHGRITLIDITANGRKLHGKADARYADLERAALDGLAPGRRRQLRNGLQHVCERVRE